VRFGGNEPPPLDEIPISKMPFDGTLASFAAARLAQLVAIERGGGWDSRSSLSCFTRSFWSAFSSV
jgi:hypothetical protein